MFVFAGMRSPDLSDLTGIAHLNLPFIFHCSDNLVELDELFRLMKLNHQNIDKKQAPRRNQIQKEVERYQSGILKKDNKLFLTVGAVLRYCFIHSDDFSICQEIVEDTVNQLSKRWVLGNVSNRETERETTRQELAIADELTGIDDNRTCAAVQAPQV